MQDFIAETISMFHTKEHTQNRDHSERLKIKGTPKINSDHKSNKT